MRAGCFCFIASGVMRTNSRCLHTGCFTRVEGVRLHCVLRLLEAQPMTAAPLEG